MSDDIVGGGGNESSGDYESAALDVLNDEPEEEREPSITEGRDDGDDSGGTGEASQEGEDQEGKYENPAEETSQEEEIPEPDIKDEDLSLVGKRAYDKIKKEFPDVLKNVPELRQLFFQNKAYTDIFTNIDEARQATNDSVFLNEMGNHLNNGNIKQVINNLSESSLNNLVEQFIPTLQEINPKLFVAATGPLLANILNDAYEQGANIGDKNLANAALWISKFLTGKPELPKRFVAKPVDPKLVSERRQFEAEKQSFYNGQVNGFINTADSAIEQGLNKLLMNGLVKDGEELSPFIQNAIIKEAINEIRAYTNKDKAFVGTMNELFRRSQKSGFDQDSKSRIVSAYLGRVKDIALKIRNVKKSEALGRKRREEFSSNNQTRQPNSTQRRIAPIRTSGPSNGSKAPRTELDVIRSR